LLESPVNRTFGWLGTERTNVRHPYRGVYMVTRRRTWIAVASLAVIAGCAKSENAAVDTTSSAASSTTSSAPATLNLADVAGKWNMKSAPVSGDTTPTNYVLTTTSNTEGWTLTFPGRAQPVPVKVITAGDSIILTAGPYPSVRRRGVQVTTNGVQRLQGGRLVGTTTAHYNVKTADSVLVLTVSGDRVP
jgi:hypothetical protein